MLSIEQEVKTRTWCHVQMLSVKYYPSMDFKWRVGSANLLDIILGFGLLIPVIPGVSCHVIWYFRSG